VTTPDADPSDYLHAHTLSEAVSPTRLVDTHSAYQHIQICEHPVYGHQLFLDGDLQISESDNAYNTAMTAPLIGMGDMQHVIILGGGDGGVLNELLKVTEQADNHLKKATLIDIDGTVIELCREHLPRLCEDAFDHPRAEVIVGDAFAYLDQARNLDGVIYDLTMNPVREGQTRREFIAEIFDKVHRALRPGGVFTMQAAGKGEFDPEEERRNRALLEDIRPELARRFETILEQDVFIPSFEMLWTFLSARKGGNPST
jgi:spermidine synthase/spermine synthase